MHQKRSDWLKTHLASNAVDPATGETGKAFYAYVESLENLAAAAIEFYKESKRLDDLPVTEYAQGDDLDLKETLLRLNFFRQVQLHMEKNDDNRTKVQ